MRARAGLVLFCLAAACRVACPDACYEGDFGWVDEDGDSYVAQDDCDDTDPSVHPLAFEDCNGIDDDCDGRVDEGWPDVDGDAVSDCDPVEICNGLDDDGDGRTDEGFADFDGDGIADCLDDTCEPRRRDAPVDATECDTDEVVEPYNIEVLWEAPADKGSVVQPVIGNLTDDNADGRIDDLDIPDVVIVRWGTGEVVVYSGDDGFVHWSVGDVSPISGAALGDVDGDGEPEVVVASKSFELLVLDGATGFEELRITDPDPNFGHPAVGDLDADGAAEIVFDNTIFDGTTGAVIATMNPLWTSASVPVIADIDDDGRQEVLIAGGAWDSDGNLLWTGPGLYGNHYVAVADLDGDRGGESVWVGGAQLAISDDDGRPLVRTLLPRTTLGNAGPPAIADFDGDGRPEIAVPVGAELFLVEADGTIAWTASIDDASGYAGVAGFDVDGDGAYDVVYRDEVAFRILDGKTGVERYVDSSYSSATSFEAPSIADVDGDGAAEIVVATSQLESGPTPPVMVYRHVGGGWGVTGPTWPMQSYLDGALGDDLSVPRNPPVPWTKESLFRARPSIPGSSADMQVVITDVCVSSCEEGVGILSVAAQVANGGDRRVRRAVPVSLFTFDDGVRRLVQSAVVPGLDAGATFDLRMDVPIGSVGNGGIELSIDDSGIRPTEERGHEHGAIPECVEDNNTDVWPFDVCGA